MLAETHVQRAFEHVRIASVSPDLLGRPKNYRAGDVTNCLTMHGVAVAQLPPLARSGRNGTNRIFAGLCIESKRRWAKRLYSRCRST